MNFDENKYAMGWNTIGCFSEQHQHDALTVQREVFRTSLMGENTTQPTAMGTDRGILYRPFSGDAYRVLHGEAPRAPGLGARSKASFRNRSKLDGNVLETCLDSVQNRTLPT